MARRRPPLYRLARALRIAGSVVLLLIIVFLGAVVYSAIQVRPDTNNSATAASVDPNGTVELTLSVNLSNPGYFAIDPLAASVQLTLPNGTPVGSGGSPLESIAAGSSGALPIRFWVPFSTAAAELLTQDLQLPTQVWLNLTYASLFTLHLSHTQNYSWGAPLAHFNASAGGPSVQTNGSVAVPITISFSNDASFALPGSVSYLLRSAGGATCSSGQLSVATPAHSSFSATPTIYVPGSCNPSGGTLTLTYNGLGTSYTFPTQRVP